MEHDTTFISGRHHIPVVVSQRDTPLSRGMRFAFSPPQMDAFEIWLELRVHTPVYLENEPEGRRARRNIYIWFGGLTRGNVGVAARLVPACLSSMRHLLCSDVHPANVLVFLLVSGTEHLQREICVSLGMQHKPHHGNELFWTSLDRLSTIPPLMLRPPGSGIAVPAFRGHFATHIATHIPTQIPPSRKRPRFWS